jgi:hypothetical protein
LAQDRTALRRIGKAETAARDRLSRAMTRHRAQDRSPVPLCRTQVQEPDGYCTVTLTMPMTGFIMYLPLPV